MLAIVKDDCVAITGDSKSKSSAYSVTNNSKTDERDSDMNQNWLSTMTILPYSCYRNKQNHNHTTQNKAYNTVLHR